MKKHLKAAFFGERCYVPAYVRMEVRRSLLAPLVSFYFTLMAPNTSGIGDAIQLWKNRFAKGEHIAVETLVAALFQSRGINLNSLRDKRLL